MKVGSFKIKNKNLIISGILISVCFIFYSVIKSGIQDKYTQDILGYRNQKDEHFKTSETSPIEDQINFKNLNYFEPNKKFRVNAKLLPIRDSSFISILNNDGEKNKYWRYAKIIFEIDKRKDTLTLFRKAKLDIESRNYFLPFYDETNGEETYEGGRYIDVELNKRDSISFILDFNLAYNPYCVYNYRFSCPVPPKENRLNRKIEAGETMYKK